ncbi:MAG: copper-binding protein [Candidatus Rokubacteria bacterium]|nr:copper-binding protein [Candidatus Rokubacteria bacterium]
MRAWKVVALVDLALALGLGAGWLGWGRQAAQLERELQVARASALFGGPEREWRVQGVVRAVLPEIGVIVVSHEDIPGYMQGMTMGFRAASPKVLESTQVGDAVRFTLRGSPPNLTVTAIEKLS